MTGTLTVPYRGMLVEAVPVRRNADGTWTMAARAAFSDVPAGTEITIDAAAARIAMPVGAAEQTAITTLARRKAAMTERLANKLKTVAGATKALTDAIEERADRFLARKAAIEERADQAFGAHEAVLDLAEQGLGEVDAALAQLTNGGPGGPLPG